MRKSLSEYCMENERTELLTQWDTEANLPQTPQSISYGSKFKAQWRCEKGHSWRAQVWSRTGNRSGCPVCAGLAVLPGENDLQTLFPEVAAEWHPSKNAVFHAGDISPGSRQKVWWSCPTCGHAYQASIVSRTQRCGCPACAGRVNFRRRERYRLLASEQPEPPRRRITAAPESAR